MPQLTRAANLKGLHSYFSSLPRRSHSAVSLAASLDIAAVDTRRRSVLKVALRSLLLPVVINVLQIESVQVPRKYAEDRETDVDEKVGAAASNDVDSDGRDWQYC